MADRIRSILENIDGVISASANTSIQIAEVIFDDTKTNLEQIKSELNAGGYQVTNYTVVDVKTYTHTDLASQEAKNMIESKPDLIIIDVREEYEFCSEHIPFSKNYPWSSGILQERYTELPVESSILVVCSNGIRSHQASGFLDSKQFTSVYDIKGGMNSWGWEISKCIDDLGLKDVILILQALGSQNSVNVEYVDDINGDLKIGIAEAINILQKLSNTIAEGLSD